MSSIEEFISIRKTIETLITQITTGLKEDMPRSREHLDNAKRQLKDLTAMVSNDVQTTAVDRLTRQLGTLETKMEAQAGKKSSGRKPSTRKPSEKKVESRPKPVVEEEPVIVIFERP